MLLARFSPHPFVRLVIYQNPGVVIHQQHQEYDSQCGQLRQFTFVFLRFFLERFPDVA